MNDTKDHKVYNSARHSKYWQQLQICADSPWSLAVLFVQDDKRTQRFSAQSGALYMDYSKQCLDDTVLENLLSLANSCELSARIQALLQGAMVNISEERAALHTALRLPATASLQIDNQDVVADVHQSLGQVERLSERVRSGTWRGFRARQLLMWSILV